MTTFSKKRINAAVNSIISSCKETDILVTGVNGLDNSGENDVNLEILMQIADRVLEKNTELTLMILVAGKRSCSGLVHVSDQHKDKITNEKWLIESGFIIPCGINISSNTSNKGKKGHEYAYGLLPNRETLKKKDEINSNAFSVLRKHGLYNDEDDDSLDFSDW